MKATKGSQKWLQQAVNHCNKCRKVLDDKIRAETGIDPSVTINWLSPLAAENYREYRDDKALEKLGCTSPDRSLSAFWPKRGPVWDALARTCRGEFLLIEAKAHIPEMVTPGSRASEKSLARIRTSLEEVRAALAPRSTVPWHAAFYQYTNRLAHLYLLRTLNSRNARLVFLYFVNARDVGGPTSSEEWDGAIRVTDAYLGLRRHKLSNFVHHVFVDIEEMQRRAHG